MNQRASWYCCAFVFIVVFLASSAVQAFDVPKIKVIDPRDLPKPLDPRDLPKPLDPRDLLKPPDPRNLQIPAPNAGPRPNWGDLPFNVVTGATIGTANIDETLERAGKSFCDLMTGGAYSRGESGCSVSFLFGVDQDGNVYSEDTEGKQYPRTSQNEAPDGPTAQEVAEQIAKAEVYLELGVPSYEEFSAGDVDSIGRFLPGKYRLGKPIESEIISPTESGVIRGKDKGGLGSGTFLAKRTEAGKPDRFHGGVDYNTEAGDPIYSPVSGVLHHVVTSVYKANNMNLTGLAIRSDDGHMVKLFYVAPSEKYFDGFRSGVRVEAGEKIGTAQSLKYRFGQDMTNHVHMQIEDENGRRVNPTGTVVIRP